MYGVPSLTRKTGKGSHMQLEFSWGTKKFQGGLQSADPCSTIIRIRYSSTMLMRRMDFDVSDRYSGFGGNLPRRFAVQAALDRSHGSPVICNLGLERSKRPCACTHRQLIMCSPGPPINLLLNEAVVPDASQNNSH